MEQFKMNIEKHINSVVVTIQDLLNATEEIQNSVPENRNWEGRTHILALMFKGQPHKAMSIDSRLSAMSSMVESGKLPGWALPEQEDGSYLIAEPVWEATATEEISFIDNLPCFNESSFLQKILSNAEAEGNA
jgi:hypothetical protein